MKKIQLFILLLVLFAACSEVEEYNNEPANGLGKGIIVAQPESSTRTLINGTVAKFVHSDAIAVFDELGTTYSKYNLVKGNEDQIAEFSGTFQGNIDSIRNIFAVYPYSAGKLAADNKSCSFALPTEQVQIGALDSVSQGKYSYMVATPAKGKPTSVVPLVFNQVTSIVNFELKNIPAGQKVTQIEMKAKDSGEAPFISEGSVDISKSKSDTGFLQVIPTKLTNSVSVRIVSAPSSNFTANIVIFPFVAQREDMVILVSTINANGTVRTYMFERENLDLSLFKRKMRTATTLDLNAVPQEKITTQIYSVWDGTTKTQPLDLNTTSKTMTINSASDLAWLADQTRNYTTYDGFNGYVITLASNLDLGGVCNGSTWSGANWIPIGTSVNSRSFKGNFDGAGYKIRNLYILLTSTKEMGLFGHSTGAISNVNIESGYLSATTADYAGAVCGYTLGAINNCMNNCSISSSLYYAGGICGYSSATVSDCVNNGTIASNYVGGICGWGTFEIKNCINNASIVANQGNVNYSTYAGGICGYTSSTIRINDCVNYGSVASQTGVSSSVGGICGYGKFLLNNCINFGPISSKNYAGGINGFSGVGTTISNCLNKGSVKGLWYGTGGITGYGNSTLSNCVNTGKIN